MDYDVGPPNQDPDDPPPKCYEYRVFPTTWKAWLSLAVSFVAGLGLFAVWLMTPMILARLIPDPFEGACGAGSDLDCLARQSQLDGASVPYCDRGEYEVCLVPLGGISTDLVHHLVDHYESTYGLRVGILEPAGIPEAHVHPDREQVDAEMLMRLI